MSAQDNATAIKPTKYNHTEKISQRRKALFPDTQESECDDLGHMSPLYSSDSNSNFSDIHALDNLESEIVENSSSFFKHNLNDYILLQKDGEEHTGGSPTKSVIFGTESNMSPLYLSPLHTLITSPILYSPRVMPLTPLGKSPTSTLKTPNDTSTVKINAKNQKRKLQGVIVTMEENDKLASPQSKNPKLDTSLNKPKVRTALFPDNDISLPTRSFYPKLPVKQEKHLQVVPSSKKVTKRKPSVLYLCNKRKSKRRYGQINAGVMHKIKKPKQKKASKAQIIKATLNILDNSALNEYINEIASLNSGSLTKQITKIEETRKPSPIKLCDKENVEAGGDESAPSNNKFFKSKRNGGVVTLNKNIKINVEDGKFKLLKRKRPLSENNSNKSAVINSVILSPLDDLNVSSEINVKTNIDNILNALDDDLEKDNAKRLKPTPLEKEELILSPTSQMCDMASGLALNSPKRAKLNINSLLDNVSGCDASIYNSAVDMEQQKLFPVFCGGNKPVPKTKSADVKTVKKWKNLPEDQLFLDAGQKKFGMTQCNECEVVYHMGDPNDELMHLNYHNATRVLKFVGWKNERVIANFINGRIIKIVPGDSKMWWKKVKDLAEVINRDLGYYEQLFPIDNYQIYLYIKNKQIVGCLMAEEKSTAYKMLESSTVDICSEESYHIKCGISRIWVSPKFRKRGIATAMVNGLRSNFAFGMILGKEDIALSAPSEMGKLFAKKYFGTDNYLIYMI